MKKLNIDNYEFFVTDFKNSSDTYKYYFIFDEKGNWYTYNSDTQDIQERFLGYLDMLKIQNPSKDYQLTKIKSTQAVDSELAVEKIEEMSESCIYYDDGDSYIFYHLYGNNNYIYIKTNNYIWCYDRNTGTVGVFNSEPQIEKRFSELQLKKVIMKKIVERIKNKPIENELVEKSMEENKMNDPCKKVKVVPKSNSYIRNDIETALAEAYEETGYVLDFVKETDKYVILYLKEKEL